MNRTNIIRLWLAAAIGLGLCIGLIVRDVIRRQALRDQEKALREEVDVLEAEWKALREANQGMKELGWEHHEPAPGVHVWTPPK